MYFRDFTYKLKHFFKTHRRMGIYAGALIVFATFLAKDVLQDHARDVVDDVNLASLEFVNRKDSDSIKRLQINEHNSIITALAGLPQKLQKHRSVEDEAFDSMGSLQELDQRLGVSVAILDEIEFIDEELSDLRIDRKKLSELSEQTKQVQGGLRPAYFSILRALHARTIDGKGDLEGMKLPDPHVAMRTISDAHVPAMQLEAETEELVSDVLKKLHEEKRKVETRYSHFELASWFLYAFGWTIGLIGGKDFLAGE